MGKLERRRKQLLDNTKEMRRYWKLKKEALDCTLWITHFERSYGSVVREDIMNNIVNWRGQEKKSY
jgi:hypothetical protein